MISGSLHDLHDGIDGSVDDLDLPTGSIGDLLNGVLYIPSVIIQTLEFIIEDFGS